MKILYVDAMKALHAQTNVKGLVNAFSKFGKVFTFDQRTLTKISSKEQMNKALVKFALHNKPDFIFLGKCESVSGESIKIIKENISTFVVSNLGDFYHEPCPFKVEQGRYADVSVFNYFDETIMQKYKDSGVKNVGYWTDGVDETMMYDIGCEKTKDVVFLGSNHSQINNYLENYSFREKLIYKIDEKFDLQVYGKGWNVKNINGWVQDNQKNIVTNETKIMVDVPAVISYLYLSWNRVYHSLPCRVCYLVQYIPGLELILKQNEHIDWFNTDDEALDKIDFYLKHDIERERMANRAKEFVLENHTYTNRVRGIIDCKVKDSSNIFSYMGVTNASM